jgi:site-specific recombinase XerD
MEFAHLLQNFFAKRLIEQQNVSKRTIAAYRDSFKLLLNYAQRVKNKSPSKMSLTDFDSEFILKFLNHLENERHNSVRTRNARLASIRAFAHYVSLQCPQALAYAQQIQAIPMKRFSKPMLGFLTRDEIKAVLAALDTSTWCGKRDQIMITLLYNTGARVSEMINIRVDDLSLGATSSVTLHGKGRKQRTVPLWKETRIALSSWLTYSGLSFDEPLVPTRKKRVMSRTNVAERLTLAVTKATVNCPQLKGRRITPHIIRHSCAMHTVKATHDIRKVSLWLGHADLKSTEIYLRADPDEKLETLMTKTPPSLKRGKFKAPDRLIQMLKAGK